MSETLEQVISNFEHAPRFIPQAHMAARLVAELRAALAAASAQPISKDERALRRLLCAKYEHLPYMDDGEAHGQTLDWLRGSVEEIETRIREINIESFAAQSALHPITGEPIGTDAQEATAWQVKAENLERENAALRDVGTGLSNIAFNIAQWAGKVLTPDICASLDKCRREWDAVPRALAGTAPAVQPYRTAELERENAALRELIAEAPSYFAPQYDFEGRKLAWIKSADAAIAAQGDSHE